MKIRGRIPSGHKFCGNNNEDNHNNSNGEQQIITEDPPSLEFGLNSGNDTSSSLEPSGLWIPNLPGVDFYFLVSSVALYCYINSLTGEMMHDDMLAIRNNKDVLPSTPVSNVFINDFWGKPMSDPKSHKSYRPITTLTFRMNYLWTGFEPYSYHVINVCLHVSVSLLFTYVCSKVVFKSAMPSYLAGLLFAVHPIHTEAVSSIVGRADVLACLFFLFAFICYTRCISEQRKDRGFARTSSVFHMIYALWLGATAMLCKEHGFTVFGVFLVYDIFIACRKGMERIIFYKHNGHVWEPLVKRCAIVCLSGLLVLGARLNMLHGELPTFSALDNPAAHSSHLLTRLLTYSYLVAFNVYLLICPITLSFDWQVGSIPLVESLWDVRNLATVGVFATLGLLLKHMCLTKDKEQRILILGLTFLIFPFLPASNIFITVGFVVAERILYIPSMGFCILLVHGISKLCIAVDRKYAKVITLLAVLLATLYADRTITRNKVWQSREELYRSGYMTLPHNAKMHYNWANYLKDTGQKTEALFHYRVSLDLYPNYTSAYNNLGTLVSKDDPTTAEDLFRNAIKVDPSHPKAHFNLANILVEKGQFKMARHHYEMCINLEPTYVDPYTNLAALCEREGKTMQAGGLYRMAMVLVPEGADECSNYGSFLTRTGQHHKALDQYQTCLNIQEDHTVTLVNMAILLRHIGKTDDAECHYIRALQYKKDPDTLQKLGALYYNTNRTELAKSVYEDAIEMDQDNIKLQMQYAQILVQMKRLDCAINWLCNHVLKKSPVHVPVHRQVASIYSMQNKFDKALDYIDKALSLVPESDSEMKGQVYFEKGNIYRELLNNDSAIESYQRAVRLHPAFGSAHMNLAGMLHLQGNYRLAKQHYTIALRYDPHNRVLIDNIAKISRLDYNATSDEVNTGEMYELLVESYENCPIAGKK